MQKLPRVHWKRPRYGREDRYVEFRAHASNRARSRGISLRDIAQAILRQATPEQWQEHRDPGTTGPRAGVRFYHHGTTAIAYPGPQEGCWTVVTVYREQDDRRPRAPYRRRKTRVQDHVA